MIFNRGHRPKWLVGVPASYLQRLDWYSTSFEFLQTPEWDGSKVKPNVRTTELELYDHWVFQILLVPRICRNTRDTLKTCWCVSISFWGARAALCLDLGDDDSGLYTHSIHQVLNAKQIHLSTCRLHLCQEEHSKKHSCLFSVPEIADQLCGRGI